FVRSGNVPTPPPSIGVAEAPGAPVPQPTAHPPKELARASDVSPDRPLEAMSVPNVRREHVPSLDGVRGIAILAVFLFHCSLRLHGLWSMAGSFGWMGVDLFFVLS